MQPVLFFDIETAANPDALVFLPEPTAPANYKDAEKIAQYVSDKKAEQVQQAPLDADLGKVIAIAMQRGLENAAEVYLAGDPETPDEKALLHCFWSSFAQMDGRACGYNILGFDLPYLLRRSFNLGIDVPLLPRLAKYHIEPIVDLMGILYNWGNARGLKWVCRRYGIPNELPDLDGSQVVNMDRDTLRKYARNDLTLLIELYKRMCGVYLPALEAYQPAFLPR
jgi:DNA polymerase elongation subunit (family B)